MRSMSQQPQNNGAESWKKRFWQLSSRHYSSIVLAAFFINIMAIAAPVYVLQVYDRVVFQGGLTTLQALVIGMIFVVIFDFILKGMKSKLFSRIGLHLELNLGRMVYDRLNATSLRNLEARPTSYWQQLFQDIDVLRNLFAGSQAALLIDLPFGVLFLAIIAYMSPPLFGLICGIVLAFILLALISSLVMRRRTKNAETAKLDRNTLIAELLQARSSLKALALRDSMRWRFEGHHANTIDNAAKRGGSADLFQTLATSLAMFSTVITTAYGALLILDLELTIGVLIAINMLSSRLINTMTQLVSQWRNIFEGRKAITRMDDFFAEKTEPFTRNVDHAVPKTQFRLDAVQFHFNPETEQNPTIDIPQHHLPEKGLLVVMGKNGSGKSTLLKLLSGLYTPNKGTVSLEGGDIQQFPRQQIAEWIGYLPQEIVLFSGTVLENIALGVADPTQVSDEVIIRAAKDSGIHDDIIAHPDGYMRELGEGGGGMSGGQRQRLCLARTLIGDRPILLLDEPTSHLDQQGTNEIARMLQDLSRTRLVIVVSHSEPLILASDFLLIMQQGKIAVAGKREDVLEHLKKASRHD